MSLKMDPQEQITLLTARAADLQAALDATAATADALAAARARVAELTAERDALAAQVGALAPPPTAVPRAEVVRRLFPHTVALATAAGDNAAALRAKWDRLLAPLQYFPTLNVADPRVATLIALARADELLTPEEAAAVTG